MDWIEVSPLPAECEHCKESECYNCDYTGKRWVLPEKQQLLLRRKAMERAIARCQRQIAEIDKQLSQMQ